MVSSGLLSNGFDEEPRGGKHAWIPIVGGLLPILYGIRTIVSGGPVGIPLIFIGIFAVTCGAAELLSVDRVRTAAILRMFSFVWLFFALVVMLAGG